MNKKLVVYYCYIGELPKSKAEQYIQDLKESHNKCGLGDFITKSPQTDLMILYVPIRQGDSRIEVLDLS